ncbi:MAG TPA: family 16 glycoside hydrolase [Terriglobia bacterium]
MLRLTRVGSRTLEAFAILLLFATFAPCAPKVQAFALSDSKELVLHNVKADAAEYMGRKAVRLTKETEEDGFALLPGTDFQDGTIEADIAVKITTPPGVRMPGFVGIAFRARPDASRYELFYLRPGNAHSADQAMRNHSVQYSSEPDFDWYKLRRNWPWIYEAYADLQPETWTKVKIEVTGRSARLYLNGSETPSLMVDGLKGDDLRGGVALWSYQGEEAYFSNVRITNAAPLPVKNGADASGTWQVKYSSDAGSFEGSLQLIRDGSKLTGTWSGNLGDARPVAGTWRDGYVELAFNADWPTGHLGDPGSATATLAGWIDGDSASGRMKVEGRADGQWTALRKQ